MTAARVHVKDGLVVLQCPSVGWWQPRLALGEGLTAHSVIGTLTTLGRTVELSAPAKAGGVVVELAAPGFVDWSSVLFVLDPKQSNAEAAVESEADEASGMVFRAPMGGRFYVRPAPDKPAFVEVGSELSAGSTVCLLEVMKTFNRVNYGADRPPARVLRVLVDDGADVAAGEPLLELEDL